MIAPTLPSSRRSISRFSTWGRPEHAIHLPRCNHDLSAQNACCTGLYILHVSRNNRSLGRELKQNAVQNNPVFLGEVRLDSSQQLDLPDAQVSLCWFEPVRYLNTAPASPNGFHRIGKRQEHDVAQNRSFTDGKFCCQMRNSIISPHNDRCIDRSSPFRRIQPCSPLPVRDSKSIAKIPDSLCHDSKSFYEKFTFCHIVSNASPVCASESVIITQQKARREYALATGFCSVMCNLL